MISDTEQPVGDSSNKNHESVTFLGPRVGIIQFSGKLRGRRARQLGNQLEDLARNGVHRVILDLRDLASIDTLGSYSLEQGVDAGLRLHLVVSPAFDADRCLNLRGLARRAVKINRDLDDAIETVRGIVDSGMQLA